MPRRGEYGVTSYVFCSQQEKLSHSATIELVNGRMQEEETTWRTKSRRKNKPRAWQRLAKPLSRKRQVQAWNDWRKTGLHAIRPRHPQFKTREGPRLLAAKFLLSPSARRLFESDMMLFALGLQ